MKIFSVYDSKVEAYIQPFFAETDAAALRMFQDAATNQEHQFCKHAGDYTLFAVGTWDTNEGKIEPLEILYNLGNALTLQSNG